MARGRPPNLVPTIQWAIMMPVDLAFQVETALMDPVTNRAKFASRSKLIQGLLYAWLRGSAMSPDQLTHIMDLVRREGHIFSNVEILEKLLDTSKDGAHNSREEIAPIPAHNSPKDTPS